MLRFRDQNSKKIVYAKPDKDVLKRLADLKKQMEDGMQGGAGGDGTGGSGGGPGDLDAGLIKAFYDTDGLVVEHELDFTGRIVGDDTSNPNHILVYPGEGEPSFMNIYRMDDLTDKMEVPQDAYTALAADDGTTYQHTVTGVGHQAQAVFRFNLVELVKREYIDLRGKGIGFTNWFMANMESVTFHWKGTASGGGVSGATLTNWDNWNDLWIEPVTNEASEVEEMTIALTGDVIGDRLDYDGMGCVSFNAYAPPATADAPSILTTESYRAVVRFRMKMNDLLSAAGVQLFPLTKPDGGALNWLNGYNGYGIDQFRLGNNYTYTGHGAFQPEPQENGTNLDGYMLIETTKLDNSTHLQRATATADGTTFTRGHNGNGWSGWKRSLGTKELVTLLMGGDLFENVHLDYVGKSSRGYGYYNRLYQGQTTEFPLSYDPGRSEVESSGYRLVRDPAKPEDRLETTATVAGERPYQIATFDLVSAIEERYGTIPGTAGLSGSAKWKAGVVWVKEHLTSIAIEYQGGSTNRVLFGLYNFETDSWDSFGSRYGDPAIHITAKFYGDGESVDHISDLNGEIAVIFYGDPVEEEPSSIFTGYIKVTPMLRLSMADVVSTSGPVDEEQPAEERDPNVTIPPNGTNFDDLFTTGTYGYDRSLNHRGNPNDNPSLPQRAKWFVRVERLDEDHAKQTWYGITNEETYTRRSVDRYLWGPWRRITNENELTAVFAKFRNPRVNITLDYNDKYNHGFEATSPTILVPTSYKTWVSDAAEIGPYIDETRLEGLEATSGTTLITTATAAGEIAQQVYRIFPQHAFNRELGYTPGNSFGGYSEWLNSNIDLATFYWRGKVSSGAPTFKVLNCDTNQWQTLYAVWADTAGEYSQYKFTLSTSGLPAKPRYVDDAGSMRIGVHAPAGTAEVLSSIEVDYFNVEFDAQIPLKDLLARHGMLDSEGTTIRTLTASGLKGGGNLKDRLLDLAVNFGGDGYSNQVSRADHTHTATGVTFSGATPVIATNIQAAIAELASPNIQVKRSGKDANKIFTITEHIRRSNSKILKRETLSGGTSPRYTTKKVEWFDSTGTLLRTDTLALTYDADGDIIQEG